MVLYKTKYGLTSSVQKRTVIDMQVAMPGGKQFRVPWSFVAGILLAAGVGLTAALLMTLVFNGPSDSDLLARAMVGNQEASAKLEARYATPAPAAIPPLPSLGLTLPKTFTEPVANPKTTDEVVGSMVLLLSWGQIDKVEKLLWGKIDNFREEVEKDPLPRIQMIEIARIEDGRGRYRDILGLDEIPAEPIYEVFFWTTPAISDEEEALMVRQKRGEWKIWAPIMEE